MIKRLLLAGAVLLPCPLQAQQLGAPWDSVSALLQTAGTKAADHFRYSMPRRDITLKVGDVVVAPALALGTYAGFASSGHGVEVMGDIVLLPAELPAVFAELYRQGITATAIHNHIVGAAPQLVYVHYHGAGEAIDLANRLNRVLAHTATPRGAAPVNPQPLGIDTTLVFTTLGKSGRAVGKVAMLSFNLVPGKVVAHDMVVPAALGYATPINVQMVDATRAVATGDFSVAEEKVQPVLKALAANGITATAMHTHLVGETPKVYFIHFWADGALPVVLKGLKATIDAAK